MIEIDAALMSIDDDRSATEHAFINCFVRAFTLRKQQRHTRVSNHTSDFFMRNVFEYRAIIFEIVSLQQPLDWFACPAQVITNERKAKRASTSFEFRRRAKENFVPLERIP